MSFQVGRYHDGQQQLAVIWRQGRTLIHLTYIGKGIEHKTVPMAHGRYIGPLYRGPKPYPLKRAVREFREVGRQRGITAAAKAELEEAWNEAIATTAS